MRALRPDELREKVLEEGSEAGDAEPGLLSIYCADVA